MIGHLTKRKLLFQATKGIESVLERKSAVYAGFDPTSDGLHVGNLIILKTLKKFKEFGHPIVALVGGATSQVGDPSGKKAERPILGQETIHKNISSIQKEINHFFGDKVNLVNNQDWLGNMNMLELMNKYGRYFNINKMLRLESINTRLESGDGMSYTEFSYPIFQSVDFHYLNEKYNVEVQIGGSDQWGNITSGIELISKINTTKECGGITVPLLTTSDGKKFGKSEGNAIWINHLKTSYYHFYQYFMRIQDQDVETLLLMLTDYSEQEITEIMIEHQKNPEKLFAQTVLANSITEEVHDKVGLEIAKQSSKVLFGDLPFQSLKLQDIESLLKEFPCFEMKENVGENVIQVLKNSNALSTNQAKKLIQEGGLYLNQKRVEMNSVLKNEDFVENKLLIFRKGKKNYFILKKMN